MIWLILSAAFAALSVLFFSTGDRRLLPATVGMAAGFGLFAANNLGWANVHSYSIVAGIVAMIASSFWLQKEEKALGWTAVIAAIAAVALGATIFAPNSTAKPGQTSASASASASASPTATTECTFGSIDATENEFTQFVIGGLVGDDADGWRTEAIELASKNPAFVAALSHALKAQGVDTFTYDGDGGDLFKDNCWTKDGYELSVKVQTWMSTSKSTGAEAPSNNAMNTGMNGLAARVDENVGLDGDLRSVHFVDQNGREVFILVRCGNVVWLGQYGSPVLPTGKTDNPSEPTPPAPEPNNPAAPPAVPETPTAPPEPSTPLDKKDQNIEPYSRDNSDTGGGGNNDPGTGVFVPRQEMETPPKATHIPPETPAPKPAAPKPGKPTLKPDPQPAPKPEPSAPTEENPETGCTPIPGVMDC